MSEQLERPAARLRAKMEAHRCANEAETSAADAATSDGRTIGAQTDQADAAPHATEATAPAEASPNPCQPEWYSIGSSDIAALLGIDPHRTAVDVWLRLVHGVTQPDNPAMKAGREAERDILTRFARRHGVAVRTGFVIRCEIDGVPMRAQLDGVIEPGANEPGALEVKCPHWSTKPHEFDMVRPALHWWAQNQWQMARTGFAWGRIVPEWGYQEDQRREWLVIADLDWQEMATEYACDWWHAYVVTKTPPPLKTPAEMAAVAKAVYPRVVRPELAEATGEEVELLREALAADDTAKAAKDYSESVRDRLRYAIRDRAGLVSTEVRASYRPRKDGVRVLKVERGEVNDGE